MAAGEDPDLEPLASLEQRIQRAVELIPRLRKERDAAVEARDAAIREADEARGKFQDLLGEVESLRQDREKVKARIEKLLGAMDAIGAG